MNSKCFLQLLDIVKNNNNMNKLLQTQKPLEFDKDVFIDLVKHCATFEEKQQINQLYSLVRDKNDPYNFVSVFNCYDLALYMDSHKLLDSQKLSDPIKLDASNKITKNGFTEIFYEICKAKSLQIIPINISNSDDIVEYVHYINSINSINSPILRGQTVKNISASIDESECPICLDLFQNKIILKCGHCFCEHCILLKNMLLVKCCPMCRADIELNMIMRNEIIKVSRVAITANRFRKRLTVVDKYDAYVQKIPTIGKIINFVGLPKSCRHCKPKFSRKIFVCDGVDCNNIIFHVFPDEYMKTDVRCVFYENHSLYKCNSCGIKIID